MAFSKRELEVKVDEILLKKARGEKVSAKEQSILAYSQAGKCTCSGYVRYLP